MILLDNLCKTYGPLRAVQGLSLEVRPGEIFGFLGPLADDLTMLVSLPVHVDRLCLGG